MKNQIKLAVIIALAAGALSLIIACPPPPITTDTCEKNGHSWGEWVQTTAPKCLTAGIKTQTCTVVGCGGINPNTQPGDPPTGHSWGSWVQTTNPTCTAAGIRTRTCTVSNCNIVDSTTQAGDGALGHNLGSWTAHATVWGMDNRLCSRCSVRINLRFQSAMIVSLTGGSVSMVDPSSNTYTASLSAFKIGKYQVTEAQYNAVMGYNPSAGGSTASGELPAKRPVENVSWFDAVQFCNTLSTLEGLTPVYSITGITKTGNSITAATVTATFSNNGYRLPTEAQWEYACRAGGTGTYTSGVSTGNLSNYAWYNANSNGIRHEVGKKTDNIWGLFDMHGNVYEWCWDWYGAYPTGTVTNYTGPTTPGTDRVYRGGCYMSPATNLGAAYRDGNWPSVSFNNLGFRIVLP